MIRRKDEMRIDYQNVRGGNGDLEFRRIIEKPEDLNGLKIRVQSSDTMVAMINAMGGERSFTEIGSFPPKNVWDELCSLLREDDLKATVSGSQMAIAW